ncbi:MAG: EAL domain-containing protein [Deltaproteobacteria bacterium]|nr:EAL domain-containing protein [Deltaproteobacteria bacterium]
MAGIGTIVHSTACRSDTRTALETDLDRAMESDEFVLHYQPIIDLRTGEIRAAEALVRWQHPRLGLLAPDCFIPLAEQTRLIAPLGDVVMRRAFHAARSWRRAGLPPIAVTVNVAPQQLERPQPASRVASLLAEAKLEPSAVLLELTESAAVRDLDAAARAMHELRELGVRFAIDDFGTGYASLDYLRRFPVAVLKLGCGLVRTVVEDAGAATIASAVVTLAHDLGLDVVAEGVETAEQFEFFRDRACDMIQGRGSGAPMPDELFRRLLAGAPARAPAPAFDA